MGGACCGAGIGAERRPGACDVSVARAREGDHQAGPEL